MDLPPRTFDAAVCGNCLQFVPDPSMALEEIEAGLDRYKTVEGAAVPDEMLVGSGTA